jgi:hypothetical protein
MICATYDRENDILTARCDGAAVHRVQEHPVDWWLVVSYDTCGNAVGIQVLDVHMAAPRWRGHHVRQRLPKELRAEVDRFMDWALAAGGSHDPDVCAARSAPPDCTLAA